MKKILIIEDEKSIREELKSLLENASYGVITIENFENLLDQMLKIECDLILLDINIPYMNGEMLLKEYRKRKETPIIMVTSRSSETDGVLSMGYGADDYITKPYNPTILLLRVGAVLKRSEKAYDHLSYHDWLVYPTKGILKKDQEEMILTKNEMIIFLYLLNNLGNIVTRDDLMTDLWNNDEYINDNALTVNISRLRKKLEEIGYKDAIETRKGQGYILK